MLRLPNREINLFVTRSVDATSAKLNFDPTNTTFSCSQLMDESNVSKLLQQCKASGKS